MKLIQYLNSCQHFDGELITNPEGKTGGLESQFSFVWEKEFYLFTEKAKEKFKNILYSEITINNNVIILLNDDITEEEYDYFMAAIAGYIPIKQFDEYFEERFEEV